MNDEQYVELNEGDQENRPACPHCSRIITDGMTFVPACRGRHCPANPGGEEEDPSLVKA